VGLARPLWHVPGEQRGEKVTEHDQGDGPEHQEHKH
jgi:hypothetical protein